MLVSIIIPVYNTEKYVKQCIESALNQTYKDIEIIVVDDGSTDESLKIIQQFSDKIKIISKENGGTASALNKGIDIMNGEWFKWLSSDDELYSNSIEEMISEVKKVDNAKKCIFYSNYDIINSEGEKIKKFIEPNYNSMKTFEQNIILLDHFVGNGTTSLIHKSLFKKFGKFDEKVGFAEDYELWLRFCIIEKCRLHLIPKALAKYRVHETQLSATKMNEVLENAEKIRNIVLSQLDDYQLREYVENLAKFKKKKPISVKVRHNVRDLMFKVLPKSTSESILKEYFKIKNK